MNSIELRYKLEQLADEDKTKPVVFGNQCDDGDEVTDVHVGQTAITLE